MWSGSKHFMKCGEIATVVASEHGWCLQNERGEKSEEAEFATSELWLFRKYDSSVRAAPDPDIGPPDHPLNMPGTIKQTATLDKGLVRQQKMEDILEKKQQLIQQLQQLDAQLLQLNTREVTEDAAGDSDSPHAADATPESSQAHSPRVPLDSTRDQLEETSTAYSFTPSTIGPEVKADGSGEWQTHYVRLNVNVEGREGKAMLDELRQKLTKVCEMKKKQIPPQ